MIRNTENLGAYAKTALDTPLPQNPEAERAVLGAIILNNLCLFRCGSLTDGHFFKDAHRQIFRAMALMAEDGEPIEILTLKNKLATLGRLELAGGVSYISSLVDVVPDVANVERYAAIIERMARKRALVKLGNRIMHEALSATGEPEEIAATAMAELSPQATAEDAQARALAVVLSETHNAMEQLVVKNEGLALVSGWPTLDELRVFCPTFVVTGSATKHGKSALMLSLADALAAHGSPTAIFSLESSNRELALRYTSMRTKIPHSLMRDWRTFSDTNYRKVAECRRATADLPVYITRGLRTAEDITLEIRRLKAVHGLKAAFIDYIQLVDLRRRVDSREERLAEIAKLFLETAIEQNVHIHALSQLVDDAGKEGKRLHVGDLAYAKAIGKSARIVNLFYRPGKFAPGGEIKECVVRWQVEANNEDRTNDFDAHFDEVTQTFAEGTCVENRCRHLGGRGPEQTRFD